MTQFLPPNLLAMFAARPPIAYMAPIDKPKLPGYSGIAQFTANFEDPATVDYSAFKKRETRDEARERKRAERLAVEQEKIAKLTTEWDPHHNEKATGDAYKTLFVSRVNYDTSENKIKRDFEEYGPVKKVRLVTDTQTGKPRGYAFVEFEKEKDFKAAYKYADGKKVDNKRVLVDVERGRTVEGWKPRRLGGGLGGTRLGSEEQNMKYTGRDPGADRSSRQDEDRDRKDRDDHDRPRRDDRRRDDDRSRRDDDRSRRHDRDDDRHRDDRVKREQDIKKEPSDERVKRESNGEEKPRSSRRDDDSHRRDDRSKRDEDRSRRERDRERERDGGRSEKREGRERDQGEERRR